MHLDQIFTVKGKVKLAVQTRNLPEAAGFRMQDVVDLPFGDGSDK